LWGRQSCLPPAFSRRKFPAFSVTSLLPRVYPTLPDGRGADWGQVA